jgi:retinol dehydrogenase-12
LSSILTSTCLGDLPECDLGSFASIQSAAKQVLSYTQRLDVLLCNAGILDAPLVLSEDGYEIHFSYLGHALLTKWLLLLLLNTTEIQPNVRVILLASSGYQFHYPRGIIFKDLKTTQQNLTQLGMFGGNASILSNQARHHPVYH